MSQAQPMDRIEFVERELEGFKGYVENLKREHGEPWKQEHDRLAAYCWSLEDIVSRGELCMRPQRSPGRTLSPPDV